jgi:hypothetical protein
MQTLKCHGPNVFLFVWKGLDIAKENTDQRDGHGIIGDTMVGI